MKVYRVKGKPKIKRYFRRGESQRYVNHFTKDLSLSFDRSNFSTFSQKLPQIMLLLILFLFSYVSIQYISAVITPKNIQYVLSITARTYTDIAKRMPAFSIPKIPPMHLSFPNSTSPQFPSVTFPKLSLAPLITFLTQSITTTVRVLNPTPIIHAASIMAPFAMRAVTETVIVTARFINPYPFFATLWDESFLLYQQLCIVAIHSGYAVYTGLTTLLPLLNPLPFLQMTGHFVISGFSILFQMIRSISSFFYSTFLHGIALLNPLPFLTTLSKSLVVLSHGILQISFTLWHGIIILASNIFHSIYQSIVMIGQLIIGTVLALTQLFTTLSLFVWNAMVQSAQFISFWTGVLIKNVLLLTSNILTALYQISITILSFCVHMVMLSAQFLWEIITTIALWTFQLIITILHLLDPRPLVSRIGTSIHTQITNMNHAIAHTITSLWNLISPTVYYLRDAIQKAASDLRIEKLPDANPAVN